MKLGISLAIGLLVAAGCGVETVPTGRVTQPSGTVLTTPTSTSGWAPPTTAPTTTATPQALVPPTTAPVEVPTSVNVPTPKPTPRPKATSAAKAPNPVDCGGDYYRNADGDCVHRPATGPGAADGATALCKDGSYSYSQNRRGTCSGHGGVRTWL
uniref:DUF3761 domain-containing protein n=1 Tax=Amycolatopsis pittospori TaxID=2749434 RepID=UPI0015F0E4D4